MEEKVVLVTGIGGNVGQGVLRNIRSSNLKVRIIGTDIASFTAGNHLCDKTYKVPYSYADDFIPTIQQIIDQEKVDLVIPTTDYEIYYLSSNQAVLNAKVAASEADTAKIYLDKYLTYIHFKELQVPFAQSWLPSEYNNELNQLIVKPREGRGSRGISVNPSDPKSYSDDYMVQAYHTGIEITTSFYVKKDGTLHGLFTMARELSNGATSKSNTTRLYDEQLEVMIKKMIAKPGLVGSINLQSIVDADGNIIPFEVNCRISGTNSIRHNLGFQDVKYTLQEYLFNEEPDAINTIDGIAVRLLYDVIYPGATSEADLNNSNAKHIVY